MTTYFIIPDEIAERYGLKYGSDTNSGLSFDEAFKTLEHAMAIISDNAPQNVDKIFMIGHE